MAQSNILVRLKPHNPKAGQVLRRYTYKGVRFDEANGWYRVTEEVARYLSQVRNSESDQQSPFAFDVMSEEQANEMAEREHQALVGQGRARPQDAPTVSARSTEGHYVGGEGRGDFTTRDLTGGSRLGPEDRGPGARGATRAGGPQNRGGSEGDPNVDNSQNHYRPGGSTSSDRGPSETHATDANPAPDGESPDMGQKSGTPAQPHDATPGAGSVTQVQGGRPGEGKGGSKK